MDAHKLIIRRALQKKRPSSSYLSSRSRQGQTRSCRPPTASAASALAAAPAIGGGVPHAARAAAARARGRLRFFLFRALLRRLSVHEGLGDLGELLVGG